MNLIKNFVIYLREIKKFRKKYFEELNLWELAKFFPAWHGSLAEKSTPLTDEQPWITFAAIEFLEETLKYDMRVYEYGVGGSTLFFANQVKEVISVEHDTDWSHQVVERLKALGYENWHISLIEPVANASLIGKDPSDPNNYISSAEKYEGKSFENYAASINKYPNQHFDLIMLDGRARPSCFKQAIEKLKKNGFLLLDNAERDTYCYIHKALNNKSWSKYTFSGPGPYNFYFWQTCVWQRIK